jgi:uncharacterized protein YkwD
MDARSSRWTVRLAIVALLSASLAGPLVAAPVGAANDAERSLRGMVNEARHRRDVHRLRMRRFLVRAARHHSREMAATSSLEHSDDLASVAGDRPWRIIGENIGFGPSMDVLYDAFMESPPHRQNQLNRAYRYVGVGMARGTDGRIWVTVLFLG